MNIYIRILFTIISLLWLYLSVVPLFPELSSSIIFIFPYLQIIYSPVCHQEASKLICGDIGCTFLCSRCTGIYTGAAIFSIITLIKKRIPSLHIKYLFIASIPIMLDVVLVSGGVYNYSKIVAFITGTIFGSTAFYYFYIGIQNWFFEKGRQPQ